MPAWRPPAEAWRDRECLDVIAAYLPPWHGYIHCEKPKAWRIVGDWLAIRISFFKQLSFLVPSRCPFFLSFSNWLSKKHEKRAKSKQQNINHTVRVSVGGAFSIKATKRKNRNKQSDLAIQPPLPIIYHTHTDLTLILTSLTFNLIYHLKIGRAHV